MAFSSGVAAPGGPGKKKERAHATSILNNAVHDARTMKVSYSFSYRRAISVRGKPAVDKEVNGSGATHREQRYADRLTHLHKQISCSKWRVN